MPGLELSRSLIPEPLCQTRPRLFRLTIATFEMTDSELAAPCCASRCLFGFAANDARNRFASNCVPTLMLFSGKMVFQGHRFRGTPVIGPLRGRDPQLDYR